MADIPAPLPSRQLRSFIDGYRISDAIGLVARLDVASLLRDGPRSAESLASELGVQPQPLYRVLRLLAAVGVFHESAGQCFALTEMSHLLLPDAPGSLRAWSVQTSSPYFREAWAHLEDSVRTGENAFKLIHDGTGVWAWRAEHAEEGALFDVVMADIAAARVASVTAGYDWGQFSTIVDVGGSDGTMLAGILKGLPAAKGIVFDQPHVVAAAGKRFADTGVADRCQAIGGSFFESIPAGYDAYIMSHTLHDWDDSDASLILTNVREAMRADSRLLLLERVIGPPNEEVESKLSDLNMLVLPGGLERTEDEWRALLSGAGFTVVTFHRTPSPEWVIEAMVR